MCLVLASFVYLAKISLFRLLQVISGQHLPRPDGETDGDVIDPYVKVRIRGHPDDENSNNKRKTEHVKNNGFHPVWDAGYFKFHVKVPQLAFIEFKVKDHSRSGSDKEIGSHVCPVEALQEGDTIFGFFNQSNFFHFPFLLQRVPPGLPRGLQWEAAHPRVAPGQDSFISRRATTVLSLKTSIISLF